MKKDLIIAGGTVIDPVNKIEEIRDVLIRGGKIVSVARGILAKRAKKGKKPDFQAIDARGCWVTPGLIDLHVHLRQPGQSADETIITGTRAAARGGITSLVTMANTSPVLDTPARLKSLLAQIKKDALVNVFPVGAITVGLKGKKLTNLDALAHAGAIAFSDDGMPVVNSKLMRAALEASKRLNRPVLDHAETPHLTGTGVVHEGAFSKRAKLKGIPSRSETLMVMRDIALAHQTGGTLHICHASCAESVELVRRAKAQGVRVSAEAAPHHFTLTDDDIDPKNASFKMKPPLRGGNDREAIIQGLADGTIDAIATDHAPHRATRKKVGIKKAPFGMTGLETAIPLSLNLTRRGALDARRFVERMSVFPAKLLGLKTKGHLGKGADADITVIDPNAEETYATTASKCRNTPFWGRRLRGLARATIVSGKIAYLRGRN
ncbi:MAG: dihydroorotase [Elusimicrobia bacterium]|nr:MAG: dihydroorotase [Elusimicrobiota bacterium]